MIVMNQCYNTECNTRECAKLLSCLPYADILTITMTKVGDFYVFFAYLQTI